MMGICHMPIGTRKGSCLAHVSHNRTGVHGKSYDIKLLMTFLSDKHYYFSSTSSK